MRSLLHSSRQKVGPIRPGAATVEFAMVVPVFFMVLLAIAEFGWAFCNMNLMTNVAREANYRAIMDGQTEDNVTTFAQDFAADLMKVPAGSVTVEITVTAPDGTVKSGFSSRAAGDVVTVQTAVPFSEISLLPGQWLRSTSIRGNCSMIKY